MNLCREPWSDDNQAPIHTRITYSWRKNEVAWSYGKAKAEKKPAREKQLKPEPVMKAPKVFVIDRDGVFHEFYRVDEATACIGCSHPTFNYHQRIAADMKLETRTIKGCIVSWNSAFLMSWRSGVVA